jgi:dephospho-CoA kinase
MKNKKIIAIIGMAGSGKSEVINYLQKKYYWPSIYLGAPTFERIDQAGLPTNWNNEKMMREKIREELGMGAMAILALPKIKNLLKKNNTIVLESLYSWDEYKILKKKFSDDLKTIAIFANPDLRFARLEKRKKRPIKTYKEFETRQITEIEGTDKGGPIAIADYTIINESSKKELQNNIDKIIKKIIK